jgi:hypothetical protein
LKLNKGIDLVKSAVSKSAELNPRRLKRKMDERILEMAIENAKAELAKRGRDISDVNDKQLEIIVNNEEKKIRDSLKNRSIGALLAVLGLQIV